ncbi:MAG TPA: LysR substrate-binding domain-containing protein [Herpetosiphonaceae bacterium]|nr:LysR substrate-binding domain-containing protein [Herpetosiphonaceae bacterium]
MELRQLHYFLEAGDLLNFTAAAQRLHITQSTLSQQIKQLELELGTPLFDRIGKRVRLTEAGRQLRTYARQAVVSAASGRQAIQDLADLQTGTLAIGATYALRARLTPALIAFAARYPGIQLQVRFGTSDELLEQLDAARLDVILTFHEQEFAPRFAWQHLFESPLALVAAPGSAWARRDGIAPEELRGVRLALPVQGYSTRNFLDARFAEWGIAPDIALEVNDIPTLFALVETGGWCTILTLATVENHPSLAAIPLLGEGMNRQAWVVWLKERYRKRAASEFCALV